MGSSTDAPEPMPEGTDDWPRTVEEAVENILAGLSDEDKDRVRGTSHSDLILFHHGWGTGIRNAFGLWKGNTDLRASCGPPDMHPDDCSMVIIKAVWERLRDGG